MREKRKRIRKRKKRRGKTDQEKKTEIDAYID